jgi:hypothetical protein
MTIRRGARELAVNLALCSRARLYAPGRGRPTLQTRDPVLEPALEELLASETAGYPMGQRPMAKRSSLQHLSSRLTEARHRIKPAHAWPELLRQKRYSSKPHCKACQRVQLATRSAMRSSSILPKNAKTLGRQAIQSSRWIRKKVADR